MPDCITVSKIGREERIIYGDTVFIGHILSDTTQAIDFMQSDEIWSSKDSRSSILPPSSFTQEQVSVYFRIYKMLRLK